MERDNATMLKALGKGTALALLGLLLNPVAKGANGNIIDIKQISQPDSVQNSIIQSDSNVLIFNQDGLRNTIRGDATPDDISVTSSALRLGSPGSDETFNNGSNGALFNFSSANLATTGGYSNFDASEITIPSSATTSLTLFDGANTEAQLTGAFIKLNVSQLGDDNDLGLNLSSQSASYQISINGNSNAMDLDVGGNGTNSQSGEFFVGAPNTDFDASITGNNNSVFNRIYSDGSNLTSDTVLSYTLDGANNEFASQQAGVSNRITADFDVDNSFLHIDQKGDSNEADIVLGGGFGQDYVQLDIRQNSTGSTGNDIELNWNGGNDGTSFYLSQDGDGHFIDLDIVNAGNQGPSVFDITQTGSDQSAALDLTGGGQFVKVTQGP
ncbi:MAG: hypothetical protein O2811_02900 [Proteobacteria bacterium]|nr:hypothetical protein [Pseudomonadota bacterium]